ncbi:MAG: phage virion morphogenesis protein [Gammaproteobacteria bacterium]|nr:MAG: phage virion morphogenesis protein [Gammaproteobacteria bacterium]
MAKHAQSNNLAVTQITTKLGQLSALLGDLSPVMQEIAGILERDVTEAFDNERNPTTHAKWADLDEKTIKQRTKAGKWPGKMLQVKGELVGSLTSDYGAKFARVGVGTDYAPAMQFGRPDKNIPARAYLPWDGLHPETAAAVLEFLDGELAKTIFS